MDLRALADLLFQPKVVAAITLGSLALAVVSALAVPWFVLRLPADYFAHERPPFLARLRLADGPGRMIIVAKNLLGAGLAVLGVLMLVLPGQGLLTLLIALALLDLPGKHAWERALVRRPTVRRALQALRQRFHRAPFVLPDC